MHEFLNSSPILHSIYHSFLILPLVYLAYALLEFFEHKVGDKAKETLRENFKAGPIVGATLGIIPICGLSDLGASLYAGKIISIGTLIALFLSTSGETLLLAATSYPDKLLVLVFLLILKFCFAGICGFIIDLCLRNRQPEIHIHDFCEKEHCHCEQGNIWSSALKHTLSVFAFILGFNLLAGLLEFFGLIAVLKVVVSIVPVLGVFFASLIGLIPGCAPLVLLLSLFGSEVISSAAFLAGLFTSTGTGLIVLYKTNRSWKQNLLITLIIFTIGFLVGEAFELTGLLSMFGV